MQKITASLAGPGAIGPRLWTLAAIVLHRSKATNARAAGAAGLERLNMLRIRSTKKKYKHWSKKSDKELIEEWKEGQKILKKSQKEVKRMMKKFGLDYGKH